MKLKSDAFLAQLLDPRSRPLLVAGFVLLVYFIPFFLSGERSNIVIHDNLDSNFVQYVLLEREGKALGLNPNTIVEAMMGGQPRMMFVSGLSVQTVLFALFSPFIALLINSILVHFIAFCGMYLLLRTYFLKEDEHVPIVAFTALAFALIPFYTIYGLSSAGTPLLLYVFMNLRSGNHSGYNYLTIGLFPFYSSFLLIGFFSLVSLGLWYGFDFCNRHPSRRVFLKGILILMVVYLVKGYQLFFQFFFSGGDPSSRTEFWPEEQDFVTIINQFPDLFLNLHYHASSPVASIFVILVLALILGISLKHPDTSLLTLLLFLNICATLIHGLFTWDILGTVREIVPMTREFQWNRFYFISPMLWFIQLGLSLRVIAEATKFMRFSGCIIIFICAAQLYFLWKPNIEFRETVYNLFSDQKVGWSYERFFERKLFESIKTHIGKPVDAYRIGSVGMHPAVTQFSGFHTVDGYLPSYPLRYKKEFRRIIAKEIEKAPSLKSYFDTWGSRCYLFSSELSYNFLVEKESKSVLKDVRYNFTQGPATDYLLSAAEIENPYRSNLIFLRSFETIESKWKIFLYQIRHSHQLTIDNSVTVEIKCRVERNDRFDLYYVPDGAPGFSVDFALSTDVIGQKEFQDISFRLPDSVKISRLVLDVSEDPEQKIMVIDKITLRKGNKTRVLSAFDFLPNKFIKRLGEEFQMEAVDGQFDPYLEFDQRSIQAYNEIRTDRLKK